MLDCFTTKADAPSIAIDLVAADRFGDWLEGQTPQTAGWVEAHDFKGQAGRLVMIPGDGGVVERVVYGLGSNDDRMVTADLPFLLRPGTYFVARALPDQAAFDVMLAWALGCYRFAAYKSIALGPLPLLQVPGDAPIHEVSRIAEGVYLIRDLINTPANDLGPAELERALLDLAERHGAAARSIVGDMLLDHRFNLIHAVGRASSRAPRLLDLTWGPETAPKITLVGKGVCFDSGGLSIKPAGAMELMKKDMGGAASVLGLAHMIMAMRLPVRLRVLIPAVENSVNGDAFRPGDVYRARNGTTVEITNTDAEGRLVLADALALADEESPDLLLVMATLTGAARVALGPDVVPFYTEDDALAEDIALMAERVQDPLWRMPLYKAYLPLLESRVADLNHVSSGRFAGSITAALFLSRFIDQARSWAHFDLYCWSPQARPGRPVGGDAQAVRALFGMIMERFSGAMARSGQTVVPDAEGPTG